jgi:hypothetical protein
MGAVRELLRAFDHAWQHKWESLSAALEGVTEEEAAWQAPCYAKEPREEGWPAPGTIRWQVAHVAHCKRHYTMFLRAPGSTERPPAPPHVPVASFAEDVDELREAHAGQRGAILALRDDQLPLPVGNGMPLGEFLAMAVRHDTWHASQIAVARRLYRNR